MKNIFLAAAYSAEAHLPELVNEIRALESIFRPLQERAVLGIISNRAANTDDVFGTFSEKNQVISIFHYAGHANQAELKFEGGGNIRGIAELFGITQSTALQFVFLNGCASKGQVAALHFAGVGAVIATSCAIKDELARLFSSIFYETWAKEGQTLEKAFQIAAARIHTKPEAEAKAFIVETRSFGRDNEVHAETLPWGLYLNPDLNSEAQIALRNYSINPVPSLKNMTFSQDGRTISSESMLELLYDFEQSDVEAQKEISEGKDPLLVLITRLPWTIGAHLRRLFALEESQSMAKAGIERLKELVSTYTELTRFISYIALSALWDERRLTLVPAEKLAQIPGIPDSNGTVSTDYIWRLKQYFALQKAIPGDSFKVEGYLEGFLHIVESELFEAYRFMEGLKDVFSNEENAAENLQALVSARTGKEDGIVQICFDTELIVSRFMRAALFLTKFRLYSIRSILVDKIRYLDLQNPYVHKTMRLHGAFSDIKLIPTPRAIASDNACILLAFIDQPNDPLAGALNLSPFYLDKSAYLEDKISHAPNLYVLKHQGPNDDFVYEYLDEDVNHVYLFKEDHQLTIRRSGAVFPAALKLGTLESRRFQVVHQQLLKFKQDFASI